MKNGILTVRFEDGFEWVYKNKNPWRSEINILEYVLLYNNKVGVASLYIDKKLNKAILIINEDTGLEIPKKEFVYNYKENSFDLLKLLKSTYTKYKEYISENTKWRYLFEHELPGNGASEDGRYTCILGQKGMTYPYWNRTCHEDLPEYRGDILESIYTDIITGDVSKLSEEQKLEFAKGGENYTNAPI